MRWCVKVLRLCYKLRIPCGVENPLTSMIWKAPPLRFLLTRDFTTEIVVDQCQFGPRWKKPTKLLFVQTRDLHKLAKRCQPKGCICSFSNKPHIQLTGVDKSSGKFWTSLAQEYPLKFANQIAGVLMQTANDSLNVKLRSLFGG